MRTTMGAVTLILALALFPSQGTSAPTTLKPKATDPSYKKPQKPLKR